MGTFFESLDDLKPGTVTVIGIPWDENSSFLKGPALAPARIREALLSSSANLCSETGMDLGSEPRFLDLGDLEITGCAAMLKEVEEVITGLLEHGGSVLSLGGDHAITYPIVKAYGKRFGGLEILQLDAHPDVYDEYEGSRLSHACPFARIMEENLAKRLVQVGIRTLNEHQRMQVKRFGIQVIEMRALQPGLSLPFEGPIYLSLDMDVLDPAYAPGVSHHEPGGMSTRDVLQLIQGLDVPILGADIVEFNPQRDPAGITAMTAAKLLKEIAALMIKSSADLA